MPRLDFRFSILPPLLGVVISCAVSFFVIISRSSIAFFLIGAFLYGSCGSIFSMLSSCFAYVADRTPAERRMLRITVLQLCFMVAGIISPIIIGPMVGALGVEKVLLIVILISVVNFAYVFIFLRNKDRKSGQEQPGVVDSQSAEVPRGSNDIQDERASDSLAEADFDNNVLQSVAGERRHQPLFRHVEPRSDDNLQVEIQR